MVLIKRYPNRKLYDTEAKQYITLENIAEMIRQGKDVTVIDFTSGEDLTALTLTQIIVEQEKKLGSTLPRDLLTSLIRAGEEGIAALQRTIHSSLGFLSQFEDETRRRIQELVNKGDLSQKEADSILKMLLRRSPAQPAAQTNDAEIEQLLTRLQVPSHADFQSLTDQIDALTQKIEELSK
jgi:polyhydroxyalkanoate synthesis repressor PhaR